MSTSTFSPDKRSSLATPPPEYRAAAFQFRPQHGLKESLEGKDALKDLNNLETADLLLLVTNDRFIPRTELSSMERSRSNSVSTETEESLEASTVFIDEAEDEITTYPFFCHRVYLKRCPYFRDLFIEEEEGPMSPILSLSVPAHAHNFFEVLRYIYTLKIDSRILEVDSLVGTFQVAELLQLDELLDACRTSFKLNWEDVISAEDFTWKRICIEQVRNIAANCNDMFDKHPHRQLKMLFKWIGGWPENFMHEVRKLISEEMRNGRSEKLDIREIEKLQQ
ncbi:hypothetical protein HK096_010912, partial [Nowakowskiella sp. JEL0078]